MRILICSGLYPPYLLGGAERSVHTLATALGQRGHSVRVISTQPYKALSSLRGTVSAEEGILVERFYPLNLYHLPDFRAYGIVARSIWQVADVWNPHVFLKVRRVIRQWQPDVMHIHHLAGLSMAPVTAGTLGGTPIVVTVHDHALFCLTGTLRRPNGQLCPSPCLRCSAFLAGRRALSNPVCSVIGPSAYILDQHRQRHFFPRAGWHRVPHGIPPSPGRMSRPIPTPHRGGDSFHAVFIGQLAEYKGVHILLEALRQIKRSDVTLTLAGSGPLLDQCQRVAQSDPRLRLVGPIGPGQRDVLLASADALVLPSLCPESFGLVIAEAQQVGLPVIASRLGGMVEMVQDGQNGLLVEPEDPLSLRLALERLHGDKDLWQRCAAGAQQTASTYDFGRFISTIETIYSEAAQRPVS